MPDLKERMVKMAANAKVAAGKTTPKTRVEQIQGEAQTEQAHGTSSSSPGSSQSPHQREVQQGKKRAREEGSTDQEHDVDVVGEKYLIPPCFGNREVFAGDNSLGVRKSEVEAILNAGEEARGKMLNEDAAAVMRVLETAMALNSKEVCSRSELGRVKAALEKAEAKKLQLEITFDDYRTKYQVQTGLQTDLRVARENLAAAVEEKKKEVEEKETLQAEVDKLKKDAAPAEGETEEEKALVSREDLIARIRQLSQDCLEAAATSFDDAIAQIRVKNPGVELVTDGTGYLHSIVNGEVVSPHFDVDMAGEEEGSG